MVDDDGARGGGGQPPPPPPLFQVNTGTSFRKKGGGVDVRDRQGRTVALFKDGAEVPATGNYPSRLLGKST